MVRNSKKEGSWCVMSVNLVFGPFYFGRSIVPGPNCNHLFIHKSFSQNATQFTLETPFQQEGAPPSYCFESSQFLEENLPIS